MNLAYLPMGSMQLGPNGELIPTSMPPSFSATPASGSGWKMSELAPVYSSGHSFAVMEPLAVSSTQGHQMVQLGHLGSNVVTNGAPQIIQTANGQLLQVLQQPQVQIQQPTEKVRGQQGISHSQHLIHANHVQPHQQSIQQQQQQHQHHIQPTQILQQPQQVAVAQPLHASAEGLSGVTVIKLETLAQHQQPQPQTQQQSHTQPQNHQLLQPTPTLEEPKPKKKKKKKETESESRPTPSVPESTRTTASPQQESSWSCETCGKMFQNRFNLKRHRMGVHGSDDLPVHRCDLCDKAFNYSDNLRRHRKNMHGLGLDEAEEIESKYVPQSDQSGIDQVQQLGSEKTTNELSQGLHSEEKSTKSYKCEQCDKVLQSKYNLKRHNLAVHKDTRILYGCDECEKNFTSITNYRRHKIMIHGDGKKNYYCDKCDKHLASKDGLRRHMESVHETLGKNFECLICGNKFLRKEYLAKHAKTHEFNYDILPADTTISSTSLL